MLAGSPLETSPQPAFINHKCMGDGFTEDTPGFPPRPELCTAYIRSHYFKLKTKKMFLIHIKIFY